MLTQCYDRLDSTNTRAARIAAEHPDEPVVVIAATQSAGRGRANRRWHSPRGGAWFSLALPIREPALRTAPVPLAAGLAVRETLLAYQPDRAEEVKLKWPNDVLIGERKVAGILCEQNLLPDGGARVVVIGVGINANVDPSGLSEDLLIPATSLSKWCSRPVELPRLIETCVCRLRNEIAGLLAETEPTDLARRVNSHLAWLGQQVEVALADRARCGSCCGVDRLGRLKLLTDQGEQTFDAGQVHRVRQVAAQRAAGAAGQSLHESRGES